MNEFKRKLLNEILIEWTKYWLKKRSIFLPDLSRALFSRLGPFRLLLLCVQRRTGIVFKKLKSFEQGIPTFLIMLSFIHLFDEWVSFLYLNRPNLRDFIIIAQWWNNERVRSGLKLNWMSLWKIQTSKLLCKILILFPSLTLEVVIISL